jgi:chemotaxis signal transduction protein
VSDHAIGLAEALRRDFDATFAVPPPVQGVYHDLLSIRIAGESFAVRRAEVTALLVGKRVVKLASDGHGLLGLVGIRGGVLPVYDLAFFLGVSRSEGRRWLILSGEPSIALAFDEFERQVRVPDASVALPSDLQRRELVGAVATVEDAPRPVLDLAFLHAEIERRTAARIR